MLNFNKHNIKNRLLITQDNKNLGVFTISYSKQQIRFSRSGPNKINKIISSSTNKKTQTTDNSF